MEGALERVLARTIDHSHARRRIAAAAALACALVVAAPAAASVTIGQLPPSAPPATCTPNVDYLQPSVTGGNLYIARQAGTITSWSTNSTGSGGIYRVKIFRRTSDPDDFQAVQHAPSHVLSNGLNTVTVNLPVESGDMLGFNESGPTNSCTFSQFGDSVLFRSGSLGDGFSGAFGPQNDVRLNISAVLVPDNGFTLGGITKDRRHGTATLTATTTNPGIVTMSGKGLKKRAAKSLAVAGAVTFQLATVGKTLRKLARKKTARVTANVTFSPSGGDPSTQALRLTLRMTRPPTPVSSP